MRLTLTGVCILVFALCASVLGQLRDPGLNGRSGGKSIYGDIEVADESVKSSKTVRLDLILYTESRNIVARETVGSSGRYRFNNIPTGLYNLVIEVEGQEIARMRVDATSPLVADIRQDLAFEWKADKGFSVKGAVSAADTYPRNSANASLLTKASKAADSKHYDEAEKFLKQIVANDPKDFPVWTELGNMHFGQAKYADSEAEYLRSIDLNSNYFPALLNLGRTEVALQNYDVAVDVLMRAVKLRPNSAEANYFLGESYLQIKKGSLAVGYLQEALRLSPKEMAEVHLRLALLYNAAGMKDKAVVEYEAFLKQKPDYPDRKKLEVYISANKKP